MSSNWYFTIWNRWSTLNQNKHKHKPVLVHAHKTTVLENNRVKVISFPPIKLKERCSAAAAALHMSSVLSQVDLDLVTQCMRGSKDRMKKNTVSLQLFDNAVNLKYWCNGQTFGFMLCTEVSRAKIRSIDLIWSVRELKLQYVTKSPTIRSTGTWLADVIAFC